MLRLGRWVKCCVLCAVLVGMEEWVGRPEGKVVRRGRDKKEEKTVLVVVMVVVVVVD